MKEYEIYYSTVGTIYETLKVYVEAESEEEAIQAVRERDFSKFLGEDVIDSIYGDDFMIDDIECIKEIEERNDN